MIVFGSLLNTTAMGVLLVIYAGMISYLGYRGFRKTKTSSDYLVAGRSANPFAMAMSYGAAFISTSALVGFGGIAGQFGMGLMWLLLAASLHLLAYPLYAGESSDFKWL